MAKIIDSNIESQIIKPTYNLWKIVVVGIGTALLFSLLTVVIERYFINLFFCKSSAATICTNSIGIAGSIAVIISVIASTVTMLRLRLIQPLLISVAVGASLWTLAQWTSGLGWMEVLVWNISLYLLAYMLFSWIARYIRVGPVLTITLIIIIAVHIVANL